VSMAVRRRYRKKTTGVQKVKKFVCPISSNILVVCATVHSRGDLRPPNLNN
jgi:hypothetical protein